MGQLEDKLAQLTKPKLLIVDELGNLPFEFDAAQLLFPAGEPPLRTLRHYAQFEPGCREWGRCLAPCGSHRPPQPLAPPQPLLDHPQRELPPADYAARDDQVQDPHILRAIGRAWGWRRRMEAGEFGTVRDLAIVVNLAERHVSRQLRLAYLAPEILKRLVYKRQTTAVTLMQLTQCAALPWNEQAEVVFAES